MERYQPWKTVEDQEKELSRRWKFAKDARHKYENEWRQIERAVFSVNGTDVFNPITDSKAFSPEAPLEDSPDRISINYTMRNVRLIHSQLSLNPPTVAPRPQTSDPEDHHRADAADRLVRYGLRQYTMQDTTDLVSLSTIIYGTGIGYALFNPDKGEPLEFDEETGKVVMEGDFDYFCDTIWNFFPDPEAVRPRDMKWFFRTIYMPYEEAICRWGDNPEVVEKLEQARLREQIDEEKAGGELMKDQYDCVSVAQYWETGLPYNGLRGRFAWVLLGKSDSMVSLLEPMRPNPHAFSRPLKIGEKVEPGKPRPLIARLPVHLFTDIDLPNTVFGRSSCAYALKIQDSLNKLDTVSLDVLKSHGVARIIMDSDCVIAEDSLTNSTWDVIRIKRESPNASEPHYMEPLPMPPAVGEFRDRLKVGIDDTFGVNESMLGQQSRETATAAMQYATQQGNMIRRRMFNKYMQFVEDVYKDFLDIVRMQWDIPRMVAVLGKEKAFETVELSGADIDGGFDLVAEYGTSLALDPITRRQEILTLWPLFEKANMSPKTILRYVRLNELESLFDMAQLGADRQREIFMRMLSSGEYEEPKDLRDHKSMLEYAYQFIMTAEFASWPIAVQEMVERHIKAREKMAAAQAQGEQPPSAAPTAEAGAIPAAMEGMPAAAAPQGPPPASLGDFLKQIGGA